MEDDPIDPRFVPGNILKRDVFSETIEGHLKYDPSTKLVCRSLKNVPLWARPIAHYLAKREIGALRRVQGIVGTPIIVNANRDGIVRMWTSGTPLQLARPTDPAWYRDARRLLREMRRRGVTHNDIAKPQNWLMTPEGAAAVIDFQLASVHRRKGLIFRVMAREDLRHLLKQKKRYAPELLTASERRMLDNKSLPSKVWLATGKRLYNFVTRKLMNWSDNEGSENRLMLEGDAIRTRLMGPGVSDVFLVPFPLPSKGIGIYAFVEGPVQEALAMPDLSQSVVALPRRNGKIAEDALTLIAQNRMDELALLLAREPALEPVVSDIRANRQNLTDRVLK